MTARGVQLPLAVDAELPVDPVELAKLPILERAELYGELGLDPQQRECAEAAVRRVLRRSYPRRPAR